MEFLIDFGKTIGCIIVIAIVVAACSLLIESICCKKNRNKQNDDNLPDTDKLRQDENRERFDPTLQKLKKCYVKYVGIRKIEASKLTPEEIKFVADYNELSLALAKALIRCIVYSYPCNRFAEIKIVIKYGDGKFLISRCPTRNLTEYNPAEYRFAAIEKILQEMIGKDFTLDEIIDQLNREIRNHGLTYVPNSPSHLISNHN
ncbi:MAG: hypothetical protein WCP93_02080 [Candidatus Berkelbacteria bacterium]